MLIFILNLIFLIAIKHPFHVSVCEIFHKKSESSLQITQRIFLDDLEDTLNKSFNLNLDLIKQQNDKHQLDSLMKIFLKNHLKIFVDSKPRNYTYLGFEIEKNDAMWAYLEITGISEMEVIEVENTILLDQFDDQINLIHITYNETLKTLRLDHKRTFDFIRFD